MGEQDGQESATNSELRKVTVKMTPSSRFPVPYSDGYSVYSALLSLISEFDEVVAQSVHDSSLGSLHSSGLVGVFGESDRSHHKLILPDQTYELSLGIVHPEDSEVFQALVNALVLENQSLDLSHGSLHVDHFESDNVTHEELLNRAAKFEDPSIEVTFESPACIEEANDVTTMFPHRVPVFRSLLGKWNKTAAEDLELDLTSDSLLGSVIEKPNARAYDTHSMLVNRVENEAGENRNIFKQGFTGECTYAFKDASDSVQNAVTALALLAEYSGVGSAVSRGCGTISTEITEQL